MHLGSQSSLGLNACESRESGRHAVWPGSGSADWPSNRGGRSGSRQALRTGLRRRAGEGSARVVLAARLLGLRGLVGQSLPACDALQASLAAHALLHARIKGRAPNRRCPWNAVRRWAGADNSMRPRRTERR